MNSALRTPHSAMVPPGYKQTEAGVIPEEWDAGGLGRFWSVTDCKHVTAEFVPNGFPVASIKEVQSRFVDLTNANRTTPNFYNVLIEGGRKPQPGDLILSRNATVGEVAQVADWHPLFAMGQDVCLLRKKRADFSTEFLQAVFQSPVVANQLSNLMVGSTFKRANVAQIRDFSVPMPRPPEQRAIAEALSDVDGLLDGLDRLIAKKRDLKQAAMQQLLTGQTRLPGFHGEWEETTLGRCLLARPDYGINAPAVQYSARLPTYLRITDISEDRRFRPDPRVSVKAIGAAEFFLRDSELVFARTGASVGKSYLYNPRDGELVFAGFLIRIRPNVDKLVPAFLAAHATTKAYWNWVRLMSMRSGQPGINGNEYSQMPLTLPRVPEQTAIAAALMDMDAELAALEQRREKTRALKQAMMQELLTGRTRLL